MTFPDLRGRLAQVGSVIAFATSRRNATQMRVGMITELNDDGSALVNWVAGYHPNERNKQRAVVTLDPDRFLILESAA